MADRDFEQLRQKHLAFWRREDTRWPLIGFTIEVEDDICRAAMPLASLPWMEAILGCPVVSTLVKIMPDAAKRSTAAKEFGMVSSFPV